MNFSIKPANVTDAASILILMQQLIKTECELEPLLNPSTDDTQLHAQILEFLKNPEEITLIASHEDTVVGFVQGGFRDLHITGNVVYLNYLSVDVAFREHGVGDLLMDAFIEVAKKRKGEYIVLQVLDSNIPAKSLYKKKGFETHMSRYLKKL